MEITGVGRAGAQKTMPGDAAKSDDDAGVLHGPVRVGEPRADNADIRPFGLADHLAQPAAVDDLGIVVQQADEFVAHPADGEIVDRRKIERLIIVQHFDAPVRRDGAQIAQGFGVVRLVVDDDDPIVGVVGFFDHAAGLAQVT